jgi:LacI family transcriptional regulator
MAEMLLDRLAGRAALELQEVWTPELIIRASDGPYRDPGQYPASGSLKKGAEHRV